MDIKSKIILISGPTASGKSNFAIKVAKKVNGEIINADSMQVYKELRVLTARPLKKDYQKIPHHLYGFYSVKKNFSSGMWLKLAIKKIKEIKRRGNIPILVGGTGLYFKALTEGLVKIPKILMSDREKVRKLQKKLGQDIFYNKLIKLDPLIKKKINKNDIQRSIRAYEVKLFTKKSIINWYKDTKSFFKKEEFLKLYIEVPKIELNKRILNRSKEMIKDGAIKEVKRYLKINSTKKNSTNKIIGVSEIMELIKKNITSDQAIELMSIKTRQYAKRQRTWSRKFMHDWQVASFKRL
ncbi:tRNA (adenosine(37)-N6)-dimethylallyltransferase MiaA [Candidatus Pelagibacter sp.]|jgi:tRNA dimethylallyltransferase|nr:tRNA (adenosine(37)-N6)-dimethylallyltransferase MiaA [Pelagibacteraceae bacterium]MDB9808075.1 tRNA (adenosine(37)-N6)-dimethylallyltransferase MiaA [Candidatus Pelagibacter sp.]